MLQVLVTMFLASFAGQFADVKIEHLKEEVKLVRIKADPAKFLAANNHQFPFEDSFVICGTIEIDDYYNFSYDDLEHLYQSIRFQEVGDVLKNRSKESCHLYFSRAFGQPAIDSIVDLTENSKEPVILARVKVVLNGIFYNREKQWDMLEVQDIQIARNGYKEWGPWLVEESQSKKKAEAEKLAAMKADERKQAEMKADEKRAAEVNKAVEAERAKYREFKINGETITAKYSGIVSGALRLTLKDGKTISTKLEKLTKEEQSWIKEKKWLKPAKKK